MTLIVALTVGVLFGAAAYLMMKRDLIRVISGTIILGGAANLFIMSAGLTRGDAPMVGMRKPFADPVVQALTLTAIVISFGVAMLVLAVVYRVYDSHQSVDEEELERYDVRDARADDAGGSAVDLGNHTGGSDT